MRKLIGFAAMLVAIASLVVLALDLPMIKSGRPIAVLVVLMLLVAVGGRQTRDVFYAIVQGKIVGIVEDRETASRISEHLSEAQGLEYIVIDTTADAKEVYRTTGKE